MFIATLKFKSDENDVCVPLEKAIHAPDAFHCLKDMDNWLRNEIKYSGKEHLQEARDYLRELINDNNISNLVEA